MKCPPERVREDQVGKDMNPRALVDFCNGDAKRVRRIYFSFVRLNAAS
jgi:hypothetical protein